jgi:hypothetical protein
MANDIIYTKHAEDMLVERRFKRKIITEAILHPDFKEPGEDNIWYAIKKVGKKYLRVVVEGKKKPYIVVSLYYDRRLRKEMEKEKAA